MMKCDVYLQSAAAHGKWYIWMQQVLRVCESPDVSTELKVIYNCINVAMVYGPIKN